MSGARDAFVAAATALAMSRGGMVVQSPLVVRAGAALAAVEAGPAAAVPADLVALLRCVRDVVDARLAGCEFGFSFALQALQQEAAAYWVQRSAVLAEGLR